MAYEYQGEILRVIDGDTVRARVWKDDDFGFYVKNHQSAEITFRLLGLDAPEMTGAEKPEGLRWKAGLEALLPVGSIVHVQSFKADSFGRWLAVFTIDGRPVTEILAERMRAG